VNEANSGSADHQAKQNDPLDPSYRHLSGQDRDQEPQDHRPYDQAHVRTSLDIATHLDPGDASPQDQSGTSERFLVAETDQSMRVDLVEMGIITEVEVQWLFGQ